MFGFLALGPSGATRFSEVATRHWRVAWIGVRVACVVGEDKVGTSDMCSSQLLWSEWGDSNARPPAPKAGALPTAQHPDKTELHYT